MFLVSRKIILATFFIISSTFSNAGSIVIVNEDSVGEGLNDQTPVSPIDGNNATTLGGQRLAVLQLAADFIESVFDFNVEIRVGVTFDPDDLGILGSAGPEDFDYSYSSNYLTYSDTWYPQALSNQLFGYDRELGNNDISVNINSSVTDYYLGFDSLPTYSYQYSLFGVVLHEIIHGLGFLEILDSSTGDFQTFPSIFGRFLEDQSLSLLWPSMTSSQRYNSLRDGDLYWAGSNVISESQTLQNALDSWEHSGHTSSGHVEMYAPSTYNSGSSGSHFDQFIRPHELMEHAKSSDDPNHAIGFAKQVLQDIGWTVFNNGDRPLITSISNGSVLNSSTYETNFVIFDNDNAYHTEDAYDWSNNGGQPYYVMNFQVSSSNQNVVANTGISISGVSNGLSISGEALRQLSIAPVPDSSGATTIDVTAADSDGNIFTESFVLTVIDPNTPPTISITSPINGYKFFSLNQSFIALANDDEDGPLANITWQYREANQLNYTGAGSGQAASTTLLDGNYSIKACVSDSDGESVCDEINILVSALGDEDGDGLKNSTEIAQGSDPYDNDSDNDGLLDGLDDDPIKPCDNCLVYSKLSASDGDVNNFFGAPLAINGDTAMIGTYCDNSSGNNKATLYVFSKNDQTWSQVQKLEPAGVSAGDCFAGRSIAIDGETAIISASYSDDNGTNSGSAYVFTKTNGVWMQTQKLIPTDVAAYDYFSHSLTIDGNIAVITSIFDDDNGERSGSAYIFTKINGIWTQTQKLIPHDGAVDDRFGSKSYISGDSLVITGANYGSIYIFTNKNGFWSQEQKLTPNNVTPDDRFGISLSIDSNVIMVGADSSDLNGINSGSVYVFTQENDFWSQSQELTPNDGSAYDYFGYDLFIDKNIVTISSHLDDDMGNSSGSVYIFNRINNIWSQEYKISPFDGDVDDRFGQRVSVSGNNIFISSHRDDDDGIDSGSAYIFSLPIIDSDSDGINDYSDNCLGLMNADQLDFDLDEIGDACDPDIDNGGALNNTEDRFGGNNYDASDDAQVKLNVENFAFSAPADSDLDGVPDDVEALLGEDNTTSTFQDLLDTLSSIATTKNVPAMGGIGLLALGLSMLGLGAVRLRKKL